MKWCQLVILFLAENAFWITSGWRFSKKIHCQHILKAKLCSKKEADTYNARGPLEL